MNKKVIILISLTFLTLMMKAQVIKCSPMPLSDYINLGVEERTNYLKQLQECNDFDDKFFHEFSNTYVKTKLEITDFGDTYTFSITEVKPNSKGKLYSVVTRVEFYKYYKDKDNDGFADSKDDFVYFKKESFNWYQSVVYEPGYLDVNRTYLLKTETNKIEEITAKHKTYFYNNVHWVRGIYGFDCDDTNPSYPKYIKQIYPDRDSDNLGGSSYGIVQDFIPECNTPQSWDYSFPYVYNGNDCNDNDSNIGTNPISWYEDSDGDGFGNINNVKLACKQPEGFVLNSNDCDDTNPNYNNKQITWYADLDGDGFGDKNNTIVAVCPPDNYVTNCYFDECPTEKGTRKNGCPTEVYNFSNERNYMYEREHLKSVKVEGLSMVDNKDVIETIVYRDALGRFEQINSIKQSPTGKDIIKHFEYNDNGEEIKEYLPFTNASSSGLFVSNGQQKTLDFYRTPEFDNTYVPFSDKRIEKSPIGRVLEQSAPGDAWELDTGNEEDNRTIKKTYEYNKALDNVKLFKVNFENDNIESPKLIQEGVYDQNKLTKTITKNENWQSDQVFLNDNTIQVFKDFKNRVILKRSFDKDIPHDTYYVYDVFGNLTFVLSPKASGKDVITQEVLNNLGYQYIYDAKGRVIEKKEPGKEKEYIVYDLLDRPVLTQNALQKQDNKWTYVKYDFKERVVFTGDYNRNVSREVLQGELNLLSSSSFYESRINSGTVIGGENVFYSNNTYPADVANINTQVVNYYDNYENILPTGLTNTVTTSFGDTSSTNTIGLLTVNKVAVLNTSHWITNVMYYDDEGRLIYTYKYNPYLQTIDIFEYKLDFTGKILETKETHKKNEDTPINIFNKLKYDRVGRFLSQSQCINKGEGGCEESIKASESVTGTLSVSGAKTIYASNDITITPEFSFKASEDKSLSLKITEDLYENVVSNTYNELGRLKEKKVGGKGTSRLQTVNYTYNVRNWLKKINDDSNTDNDLFNLKLSHNDPTTGKALFNGNISEVSWSTLNIDSSTKKYVYEYDALNRLVKADDNTTKYNMTTGYDKNGNILSLTRKGHVNSDATVFNIMDNLAYEIDEGNRLKNVTDNSGVDFGFKDVNTLEDDYVYDVNGNLIKDLNKEISSITYNHLNLPVSMITNKGTIHYVYDALGNRLSKTIDELTSSNDKKTEYAGNYVYHKNGSAASELQFVKQSEGYIKYENEEFTYVYQYKDHLGNIRLSYADLNKDGNIDKDTEILDESNYYPFGMKHKDANSIFKSGANFMAQKYGYNGKEYEQGIGIDLYEMDWRSYDPVIGRWLAMDPVIHFSMSPYTAFDNNPIFWSDPSGRNSDGYYGMYDLEWGGYMTDPRDPNFNAEGQAYGYDYNFDGSFDEGSEYLNPVMVQAAPKFNPFEDAYDDIYDYEDFERDMDEFDKLNIQIISKEDWSFLKTLGRGAAATSKGFGLLGGYLKVKNTTSVLGSMNQISSNVFVWNKIGTWSPKIGQTSGIFGWTFLSTKTFKAIGRFGGFGSMLMSGVDVLNGDISAERGIADSAATFAMMYGGPWGMALGITYHGLMWANDNGYLHPVDFTKLDEGRDWQNTCFVAGTKILLNNGVEKNIEDVRVGDSILSVDMNTMKVEKDVVVLIPLTQEKYTKIRITSENGIENIASPHHPFYVKGKGWAVYDVKMAEKDLNFKVSKLEVGDVIYYYEKNKLKETKITKLVDEKEKVKMYNLKYVKKNNTFFANGILVHNRYN